MPLWGFGIGYGEYDNQGRIARLRENTREWSLVRWVPTNNCYNLEVVDQLTATAEITDAAEDRSTISAGSCGSMMMGTLALQLALVYRCLAEPSSSRTWSFSRSVDPVARSILFSSGRFPCAFLMFRSIST